MISRPMLAADVKDPSSLQFPLIGTPKLDGIRCFIHPDLGPVTRAFKPIPNVYVRSRLRESATPGMDGELMLVVKDATFNDQQSAFMSREGVPKFFFHVFDLVSPDSLIEPYQTRLAKLKQEIKDLKRPTWGPSRSDFLKYVPHKWIRSSEDLVAYEDKILAQGYEGVCLRDPDGPYKEGRSTLRQHYLLKLKRFQDAEAEIVAVYEQEENTNAKKKNELGLTSRSSHKAGKRGKGILGGFEVRDSKNFPGFLFKIGTGRGLTMALRKELWAKRDTLIGRTVKYRYQDHGTKNVPRIPILLGFRDGME